MKATGHFPHISAPEETIDTIKGYIRNLSWKDFKSGD
jgi:hypothetical protein